jgi:hypothetical protein
VNEDEEGGTKYWAHPYFDRSGKLGSFTVAREPDQNSESFGLFYTERTDESLNIASYLKTRSCPSYK